MIQLAIYQRSWAWRTHRSILNIWEFKFWQEENKIYDILGMLVRSSNE